jgi:hypothetical protein
LRLSLSAAWCWTHAHFTSRSRRAESHHSEDVPRASAADELPLSLDSPLANLPPSCVHDGKPGATSSVYSGGRIRK